LDPAWVSIGPNVHLIFANRQTQLLFSPQNEARLPKGPHPLRLPEKSPVCEIVVQRFHFTSNTAMLLKLHDQFCAGQSYTVMDNGVYLAENFPDLPTICGVSTAYKNLQLVYSPQFMDAEFALPAGEHKLLIVVKGSRVGSQVSTMAITLHPNGPVVGGQTFVRPTLIVPRYCDVFPTGGEDIPTDLQPICRINKLSREVRYVSPSFDPSIIRE